MNDLTKLTTGEALVIFTGGGLDKILKEIEEDATNFVADAGTRQGRAAIITKAREVASKKVKLDAVGKELVADWKQKAKKVDVARKKSKDFLDEVRDEVRRPVTEWEDAEEKRIAEEGAVAELEEKHAEAIEANEFFDKQRDIERREAEVRDKELKAQEVERKRNEEIEREKRDKEIAEDARKDAEAKAEREKNEAVEAERLRNEAIEKARVGAEREAKEKAEKMAANAEHRKKIVKEAVDSFVKCKYPYTVAENFVKCIDAGKIDHITINY